MRKDPEVAVVDEAGELDDVREILEELGIDFASWTKRDAPDRGEPRQLLVATAGVAVSLSFRRHERAEVRPVWIAITHAESRSQRNLLLQAGFDYLIRRPVHPAALRLLLQRGLFCGDEQRRLARVAVGYRVSYRTGWLPRRGTLVDLSVRGCRLLVGVAVPKGTRIRLQIPGALDSGPDVRVETEVLRVAQAEAEGGKADEFSLALRFVRLDRATHARLRRMVESLLSGPAMLEEAEKPAPRWGRARVPRAVFDQEVRVVGSNGESALVGRDLSRGGMRIDSHPCLEVGDTFRLALPCASREEPLILNVRVVRDDGARGLGLLFDSLDEEEQERLDEMVASYPAIESLRPDGGASALIFSRIVPTLQRVTRGR